MSALPYCRRNSLSALTAALFLLIGTMFLPSCSKDEPEVRQPKDILGIWSPSDSVYLEFSQNNEVHHLVISEQDGISIGDWSLDVFFYEPGYNIVIYVSEDRVGTVYQIISLTDEKMTWCPVEQIRVGDINRETIGQIIGEIINKAQEGFNPDPALFQTFTKISENRFLQILDNLGIMYPWSEED